MAIFEELTLILGLAFGMAVVMRMLKQPLLMGYILTGVIVGPMALNLVKSREEMEFFSTLGVTTLLFIMGLNLSFRLIKELGRVVLIAGVGQVVVTALIGVALTKVLGFSVMEAVFVGVALSFSSTIVVLKLLADRGEIHKIYSRVTIGFMLVQDIIAAVILMMLSPLSGRGDLVKTGGGIIVLGILIFVCTKYVLPMVTRYVAHSSEMLFLFSIIWGFGLAGLFRMMGFSMEVGALLAGVALTFTSYTEEIASRMKPLKDFFVVMFFILLGTRLDISGVGGLLVIVPVLALFVIIGKPVIAMILMKIAGYKNRVSFLACMPIGQISEFSLILIAMGSLSGVVGAPVVSMMTMLALLTIAGSSYFTLKSEKLYEWLRLKDTPRGERIAREYEILLFGHDRVGKNFVDAFVKLEKKYLVVDFNPDSIARLKMDNIPCVYGDAEDVEFLSELNLEDIKLCVSTVPDLKANLLLVKRIRGVNKKGIVMVISQDVNEAHQLYEAGATYVMMPHYLGAAYAAHMIKQYGFERKKFDDAKTRHLEHLQQMTK